MGESTPALGERLTKDRTPIASGGCEAISEPEVKPRVEARQDELSIRWRSQEYGGLQRGNRQ